MQIIASNLHLVYSFIMKKDFVQILKKAGLKVTPSRKAVLETFSYDCKPINAESIHEKLKNKGSNLVTVYRTLASLEMNGILKRIDLRKGSAYYELSDHHHHHITCTSCGRTDSFETCNIDKISKKVLMKCSHFRSISQHSLELYGMCNSCSKR